MMNNEITVLIDAGHGVETEGKRTPEGIGLPILYEYNLNRHLEFMLMLELERVGVNAYCLYPQNDEHDYTIIERARKANCFDDLCENSVLISLHHNAGGGHGFEVYTSPGKTNADTLADCIYKEVTGAFPSIPFRTDFRDGDADKEEKFGILMKTRMPAVLFESLFMDNTEDNALLCRRDTFRLVAVALRKAILRYINIQNSKKP